MVAEHSCSVRWLPTLSLQALGQMTEMLRLMAANQEACRVEKLESHNNWKDFSFQFATDVGAKKMVDLVIRAGRNPIFELYSDEEILTASNHAALFLLVGGEAMAIVRGVPVGEGWLAWNKIVSRFDPKTPAKALLAVMAGKSSPKRSVTFVTCRQRSRTGSRR